MGTTSSAFAQALAIDKATGGPRCSVGRFQETDHPNRDEIMAAIDDGSIMATSVSRACKTVDVHLGADTIRRHRNGDCKCPVA